MPRRASIDCGDMPNKRADPLSGRSSPSSSEMAVVFPAPLGPSSASNSPGHRQREIIQRHHVAESFANPAKLGDKGVLHDFTLRPDPVGTKQNLTRWTNAVANRRRADPKSARDPHVPTVLTVSEMADAGVGRGPGGPPYQRINLKRIRRESP
jgi:hypothetical protein